LKVITGHSLWKGFLRRAKDSHPKEHVEALWGQETVDTFRIIKFNRIRLQEGKPHTSCGLEYTKKEMDRQKRLAKEAGLMFLGTVHTHPLEEHDHAPTETDHNWAVKDGERIMGVVNLFKPKKKNSRFVYKVGWWFPQSPAAFEILPE
jgi:hypothetical protein